MDWSNPWVIGPLCAVIGVLVGMFIMRLLGGGSRKAQQAADELRDEFNEYRASVGQHFATTSDLFQDMTEKYRDVYNHMASGAQEFGGRDSVGPRLELVGDAQRLDPTANADGSLDDTVQDAQGDATKATSGEDPLAAADDVVSTDTAPAEASATDAPKPPIDYDAQPATQNSPDATNLTATSPEQPAVTPPPPAR